MDIPPQNRTAPEPARGRHRALAGVLLAGVLLLQLYSRYAAAPVTDFTVDDWGQLDRASWFSGFGAIWNYSLHDVNRPIHLGMLITTFHWLGDNPPAFFLFGAVVNTVLLTAGMGLVFALTRRFRASLLYGIAFSLWPTVTESFHFWAHVSLAYVYISYIASALCWIFYTRHQQRIFLVASLILYAIGLGSYEFGIALPLIFMVTLTGQSLRHRLITVAPFLAAAALFLLWRFTQGFGLGRFLLCGPEYLRIDLSMSALTWNLHEILSWWAGGKALLALRNGLESFANLPAPIRLAHAAVSAAIGLLIYVCLRPAGDRRSEPADAAAGPFRTGQVVLFGLLWAALGQAPNLLSTASARHLLFPLIGLLIAASAALDRVWNRKFAMLLALAAPVCLLVNQGTSEDWRDAGRFNRRLYEYVKEQVTEWKTADVVVFDTRSMRQHFSGDLTVPASSDPQWWAFYGNAHLLRGFAVNGMVRLAQKGGPPPIVLLDTEHGTRAEGNQLLWHERYDPDKPHVTPLDRVHVFDCFEIARPDREDRR